ncbi:MAG: tRNA (N(6)-L-threonylcarbamoyladenosine(37)-C(2))-methylthiotransferase MtaB [Clostridia bacterium]|nr:tRNA (N(6)-L-threonylcarbamoyladenosine(37)-C(2))-methylthiotransferase MtaB [Clostridia bacterium]
MQKKTVGIYTLGCKVNQYESEAIAEELARKGFEISSPAELCDAYIINTCTVTAESDRKARQFIRRAITKNPDAYVVVTGCLAQTSAEAIAAIDGVDAVVGNSEKLLAARELRRLFDEGKKADTPRIFISDIDVACFEKMQIHSFERTRAYIKIEDGCESRCTYCIIPSARGKIRSKAPEDVIAEVKMMTERGCREIVLTGIETASYGKDLENADLASLLEEIDKIEGIGRVRLGSLDPSLIRPDFVRRIAKLSSLAPHFHLSLQSGSSRVLATMKRKYNADQAMHAIELLREAIPNVKFTTDVIVGFPGESEEDFLETADFLRRARFLMVHLFPYSKRKGTPAAEMTGQIPTEVKRRRLHELEAVAASTREELLRDAIVTAPVTEVLFETYKDGVAYGHTADFLEVAVPSERPLHGEFCRVRLNRTDNTLCFGEKL